MNADDYVNNLLKDGDYTKHTKTFIKDRWTAIKKPTWEGFYNSMKKVLFTIFKLFFMFWLFTTKLLPTQGFEKTVIFLIIIIIILLINRER